MSGEEKVNELKSCILKSDDPASNAKKIFNFLDDLLDEEFVNMTLPAPESARDPRGSFPGATLLDPTVKNQINFYQTHRELPSVNSPKELTELKLDDTQVFKPTEPTENKAIMTSREEDKATK